MDVARKKQHLLQQAAHLIGRDGLSERLGVPQTTLDAWMQGNAIMPDRKFVALAAALADFAERSKDRT